MKRSHMGGVPLEVVLVGLVAFGCFVLVSLRLTV